MGKTFKKYKGRKYPDKDAKNRKPARSCLNNGGCPYCENNKLHKHKRRFPIGADDEEIDQSDTE